MPTPVAASGSAQYRHQNSLEHDLVATAPLRTKSRKRKATKDDTGESFVDAKASRKILKIGQELEEEDQASSRIAPISTAFTFESRIPDSSDVDEGTQYDDEDDAWGDEEDVDGEGDADVDPGDLDLFNKFMPPPPTEEPTLDLNQTPTIQEQGTNLADLILHKIAIHEAAQRGEHKIIGGGAPEDAVEIPAKIVEVYTEVGHFLSRYKSGKLPKPFKIIPGQPIWENLLAMTRPDSWTANACFEATKIFVSAKPIIVRRFMETVILDRVREDIRETKKLNVHLYGALKKAAYKPKAFFQGFLFPLIESGTCTLREAHIIASVIVRVSIPTLHSSAALMRLTDIAAEQASMSTEGGGATNIFIRALLDKRYALPFQVIDNLVFHFLRFRAVDPMETDGMTDLTSSTLKDLKLPVLWHQSLLVFAQRYRNDITEDQREALLDLIQLRGHKDIGPEIRRELLEGRGRGVVEPQHVDDAGDDTMMMSP